ncbi:MAG TPA: hypothetical protein VFJ01_05980 [Oleiagrimonas sp.]|nr:hypothetical protein [Oleiagrimonas sp.]
MAKFSASFTSMDTAAESRDTGNIAVRILLRIFLVLCGIGLFVAAGIGGGLLALHWLV